MDNDKNIIENIIEGVRAAMQEQGGISQKEADDWSCGVKTLAREWASSSRHPLHGRQYKRRLEYILKQLLATIHGGRSIKDNNGFILSNWSTVTIEGRIKGLLQPDVPKWVVKSKLPIDANKFRSTGPNQPFEQPELQESLAKDALRINGRHAELLKISTYGPHELGGQRF